MIHVLVKPEDDDSITPDIWLVDERSMPNTCGTHGTFRAAFEEALDAERQRNPDEWNITDVFVNLRNRGWKIELVNDPMEVSY